MIRCSVSQLRLPQSVPRMPHPKHKSYVVICSSFFFFVPFPFNHATENNWCSFCIPIEGHYYLVFSVLYLCILAFLFFLWKSKFFENALRFIHDVFTLQHRSQCLLFSCVSSTHLHLPLGLPRSHSVWVWVWDELYVYIELIWIKLKHEFFIRSFIAVHSCRHAGCFRHSIECYVMHFFQVAVRFFLDRLSLKIPIYSFRRIISWEEIAPVKFSTSSRGNPGKKPSLLHLPKNTRRREGVDLVDPKNPSPLQYPKGTSACPPASHCQWRLFRSGQWRRGSSRFLLVLDGSQNV